MIRSPKEVFHPQYLIILIPLIASYKLLFNFQFVKYIGEK